ncbi:MAG TPA: TonB-dependent receptor plug domain-containing protein [Thermoanaerobaculia bacterium]|nr:TonB-dependent receptor plug domain-containing protein [Thermoanaerobaculia bacterium]
MRPIILILTLALCFPAVVLAQQSTTPADNVKAAEEPLPSFFAETTVTATGSERNVFDIATPVTVMRQEKIEQKTAENPADLLREQPGVDVNGVGPNQVRPVIRGQRGLRVLFLEDGLRLNNPRRQTDFGEIGGLVDLHNVGSIEVVRGPASVLYGSDAIGGVMNAVSSEPQFRTYSNVAGYAEARHSSAGDLSDWSAGLDAKLGRFTFQLGGTQRESENYRVPAGRFGAINLEQSARVLDTGATDGRSSPTASKPRATTASIPTSPRPLPPSALRMEIALP